MLKVELHTAEIPNIFLQFKKRIGENHWIRRVADIKPHIRGNPLLKDYFIERNDIAFALTHCSQLFRKYGQLPPQEINNHAIYPALSFAAQTLSIMDQSSPQQAARFVRRIHGAFKKPDEMRAIQLELSTATHFVHRKHSIAWPDMEGGGTFDILVKDIGIDGLEVECKSIAHDKGRKIHSIEAMEFHSLLKKEIDPAIRNLKTGLIAVLTINGRLPDLFKQRKKLAQHVIESILSAKSASFDDGSNIRISEFDVKAMKGFDVSNPNASRKVIEELTGTENREIMIRGNSKGGTIIFVLQSHQDDKLLKSIFDTLSDSAKRQFSKERGAIFVVGLNGVDANELVEIASQDHDSQQPPTALRIAVSDFLSAQNREHIVGVNFISRSALIPSTNGIVSSGGSAYVFKKQECSFWHQDFESLLN